MLDELLKFWPVLIFPVGLTALYLGVAKATPQELEKVKTWWATTSMVLICIGAIGWYGIQCAAFVLSEAPITRQAIGLFALNLIDIGLAWVALILFFVYKEKRANSSAIREIQIKKNKLDEELLDAVQRVVLAKSKGYTDEQIRDLLLQLNGRPVNTPDQSLDRCRIQEPDLK